MCVFHVYQIFSEYQTQTHNIQNCISPSNISFILGMGMLFHVEEGVGEFKQHDIDISYWTEKKKTLCRIFRLVQCTIQIILSFAFRFVDFICLHRIRSFSLSYFVCRDQQTCSNISYKWV